MSKNQKNIQIPFDKDGNLLKQYRRPYWAQLIQDYDSTHGIEWKTNYEFYSSMVYIGIDRGPYSDKMVLKDQDTGKTYHVTMRDFPAMMQYFRFGVITGRFTFKRANNKYFIKFVREA